MSYDRHVRQHDMQCVVCNQQNRIRISAHALAGGVRAGCDRCGGVTIHRYHKPLPDADRIGKCPECGRWSGGGKCRHHRDGTDAEPPGEQTELPT